MARKFQSLQKLAKKITHFTIQFHSKNLTHFMNLNLIDSEKSILSQHNQKPLSLYKFSSKHLVGVRKNICTVAFLDFQELHSQSTLKANFSIFLYISISKLLFQRRSKLLSGLVGRLNNFLKAARYSGFVKCSTILHFN